MVRTLFHRSRTVITNNNNNNNIYYLILRKLTYIHDQMRITNMKMKLFVSVIKK